MSKRRYRAAAVQTLARLGDYDFNIALARRYVDEAVRQGAELVVFPECMDTGYLFDSAAHCLALAEPVPGGQFVDGLAALASNIAIYIASGITERGPAKEKIFNSGILFGRNGDRLLTIRSNSSRPMTRTGSHSANAAVRWSIPTSAGSGF